MNYFKFYLSIIFCFAIKSKSILNKSKLYINSYFEEINNLNENKTQIKNTLISFFLKVIKHGNNYSIILSNNSIFLSPKKNLLRKLEENDTNKTFESEDDDEDLKINEEILEEIKK